MILGGYVIVGGIGLISIIMAKTEQHSVKRGNIVHARRIASVGHIILPIIAIAGMIFVGHFVSNIWF